MHFNPIFGQHHQPSPHFGHLLTTRIPTIFTNVSTRLPLSTHLSLYGPDPTAANRRRARRTGCTPRSCLHAAGWARGAADSPLGDPPPRLHRPMNGEEWAPARRTGLAAPRRWGRTGRRSMGTPCTTHCTCPQLGDSTLHLG